MQFLRWIRHLALAAAFVGGQAALAGNGAVTVFAAASLKDALDEIADDFERMTGTKVVLSFAASSALARQIAYGAPADVFISASLDWMDDLAARGGIVDDSRFELARNRLALVGPMSNATQVVISKDLDLVGFLNGGRLAMALTDAVPAGIYGKAALVHLGLWDDVAPQVAQTDNVRAALALVSLGAAPAGIVYATDARAAPSVSLMGLFPQDSHPPIVYPAARVSKSEQAATDDFLAYLQSDDARSTLVQHGFLPPQH